MRRNFFQSLMTALLARAFALAAWADEPSGSTVYVHQGSSWNESPIVNLRLSPIGYLFGIPDLNADFIALPQFTLGPKFQYASETAHPRKTKALLYGLALTYYTQPISSAAGWYGRTSGSVTQLWETRPSGEDTENLDGGFTMTVGHFWHWRSGFNFQLGTGFAWYATQSGFLIDNQEASGHAVQPILEASVGWEL